MICQQCFGHRRKDEKAENNEMSAMTVLPSHNDEVKKASLCQVALPNGTLHARTVRSICSKMSITR